MEVWCKTVAIDDEREISWNPLVAVVYLRCDRDGLGSDYRQPVGANREVAY